MSLPELTFRRVPVPEPAPRAKNVLLDGGATWVHPDAALAALERLMPDPPLRLGGTFDTDWYYLRAAVSLLDHIARHPAGTEAVVKQVRQYRRRIKGAKP